MTMEVVVQYDYGGCGTICLWRMWCGTIWPISPVKCSIVRDYESHIHNSCEYDAVPHFSKCSIVKNKTGALKTANTV